MLKRQISALFIVLVGCVLSTWTPAAVITVRVLNNFFEPPDITINVGDTVQWRNISGVAHNVVSCFPGQFGCDDQTSDATFSSGAATTFFNYTFTFTEAGFNPYICQPHAPFMIGSVTVVPPTPPAVSDGSVDPPMEVFITGPEGIWLGITWSIGGCPGADGFHIIYGGGSDLPAGAGGTFGVMGARCALANSPYIWTNPPDPAEDARKFIWWLVLTNDDLATEGSWGHDSQAQERIGPDPDGASGECGMVQKDLGNTCGQ